MLFDRAGKVIGEGEAGPSNHLTGGRDRAIRALADAIGQAARHGSSRGLIFVCGGLAGVDYDGAGADDGLELLRQAGFPNAAVYGDMVIAHRGALAGSPGVVAISGTGSALLGIDPRGRRAKAGGWGPIYGDEGSAYGIAREALAAAAAAFDGRGRSTSLVQALCHALEITSFDRSIFRVYDGRMQPRDIASLCSVVEAETEAADPIACEIMARAAEALAAGVPAIVKRLDFGRGPVAVSWQGSTLAHCRLLRERFAAAITNAVPRAATAPPKHSPIIGAYLLGCETLGWEPAYGL
jgi:N-acetylglucosamine kinase